MQQDYIINKPLATNIQHYTYQYRLCVYLETIYHVEKQFKIII